MIPNTALDRLQEEAENILGEKAVYNKDMELSSVKSISYSLNKISKDVYLAVNKVSFGTFYNFFTLDEMIQLKKELVGNKDMTLDLKSRYSDEIFAQDREKKAKEFLSLFLKNGLKFSINRIGKDLNIFIDMSCDKLFSNHVWNIMSQKYNLQN